MQAHSRRQRLVAWGIGLALLAIAWTVRVPALGSFAWPDEQTWLERSAAFVTALERGDLAGTYLSDHPGVVPMWGFGAALYARARLTGDRSALDGLAAENYQGDVPTQLATAALFTVLCTSLATVAAYGLLIPLLGRPAAALAGLLIALNPFYLTQSRVVHVDALLTSFMLLAVLSLLVYLKRPEQRRYLFLSGVMGGLALLTKTPALFLVPLVALALGLQWLLEYSRTKREGETGLPRRARLWRMAGAYALWLGTAWVTFVLLWPAAWTRPFFLTYRLFRASQWGAAVSHGSNFFLGQAAADPGGWFYAVVFPFRLSPLVLLLLPVSLVLVVIAWKRKEDIRLPAVGWAFLVFFTLMMSLAAKKGDRYLLPVYPVADVVAAWTLLTLVTWAEDHARNPRRARQIGYGLAAVGVLLCAGLWLRLAPYYGAYFNPLLGGGPVAARTFAFGQGEGLDLAARYLNEKQDGNELLVVTFYPPQFRYYSDGMATSLRRGEWDNTWQFADYVVFYISQVQRQLPTKALVDFFLAQEPEYVVRLGGVDMAQVYRSPVLLSGQPPATEQKLEGLRLGDSLEVVGCALSTDRARPGEEVYATLLRQAAKQLSTDYELQAWLVGESGEVVWEQSGPPFEGHYPTSWWPPGRTVYDRYRIVLPGDLTPGTYRLVAGAREPDGRPLAPEGSLREQGPGGVTTCAIRVESEP